MAEVDPLVLATKGPVKKAAGAIDPIALATRTLRQSGAAPATQPAIFRMWMSFDSPLYGRYDRG